MLPHILPLIPSHKIYTEAFFGGGAVFFAKDPVRSEIINDTNLMVANFYEVVQTNFQELKEKIEGTLYSRAAYSVAHVIYRMPHLFSKIERAWAFYVTTNMGFSGRVGSWAYDKYGGHVKSFQNKKLRFDESLAQRLSLVQVENNDACKVIESRDALDAFHYIDPPYIDANQGHYGGYAEVDFQRLLNTLGQVKGKFLLSTYHSEILSKYTEQNSWNTKEIKKPITASNVKDGKARRKKVEVLTANYLI